jgi:hypothetical protein
MTMEPRVSSGTWVGIAGGFEGGAVGAVRVAIAAGVEDSARAGRFAWAA